jgi:hypothetical protein
MTHNTTLYNGEDIFKDNVKMENRALIVKPTEPFFFGC